MRRSLKKILGIACLGLAIPLLWTGTAFSYTSPPGTRGQECVVQDGRWSNQIIGPALTLPVAMFLANSSQPPWNQWCQKKVSLMIPGNRIQMLTPLEIKGAGSSEVPFVLDGNPAIAIMKIASNGKGSAVVFAPNHLFEDGEMVVVSGIAGYDGTFAVSNSNPGEGTFVISTTAAAGALEGRNGTPIGTVQRKDSNHKVEFDANSLQGQGGCVITINKAYVQLNGIAVTSVPPGMSAICIASSDGTLKAVTTDSGSNGVVFSKGVKGGRIEPSAFIKIASEGKGYAIDFGEPGELSLFENAIIPVDDKYVIDTNDDGVIVPPDKDPAGQPIPKLRIQAPVERLFKGASPVQVCLQKTDEIKTQNDPRKGKIRVRGFVVDVSKQKDMAKADVAEDIIRLQIYNAKGFYGYVGPWNDAKKVGMASTDTSRKGVAGRSGKFEFYLPKNTEDLSQIVLLPENAGHMVGAPSEPINLSGEKNGKCLNRVSAASSQTDGGGGGGNGPTSVVFLGSTGVRDCQFNRGITEGQEGGGDVPEFDSDGDGIFDDDEDTDKDCVCDTVKGSRHGPPGHPLQNESCYLEFDSDFDGIPDGAGQENLEDTDTDTTPNVLDDDSDGDNIKDGLEDRNQYFRQRMAGGDVRGLLYRYQSTFGISPVRDPNKKDALVECSLSNEGSDLGVRYAWYMVTCKDPPLCATFASLREITRSGDELPKTDETKQEHLAVLACRSRSLVSKANFNGSWQQGNLELDAYDVDTDKDTLCDGSRFCGEAGGGPKKGGTPGDKCPLVNDLSNICAIKMPCYSNSIWYSVRDELIEKDPDTGEPTKPVDKINWKGEDGKDDVPDFLQEGFKDGPEALRKAIENNCPVDTDDDGIPDCVENPYGECPAPGGKMAPDQNDPSSQTLKYYSDDSDGDGKKDGHKGGKDADVCPESFGKDDNFTEGKAKYSCDPQKVYDSEKKRVLSCFIDRDGDGLRDCEEDRNLDGKYDRRQNVGSGKGLDDEALAKIETYFLSGDSDEDGLTDFQEVKEPVKTTEDGKNIHTNPVSANTDSDTIPDGKEDRDGKSGFALGPVDGQQDCPGFAFLDTDPTESDTDGDHLADNVELEGNLYIGNPFLEMIKLPDELVKGIDLVSNPRSADSDNDGLTDDKEYDGRVGYNDSNPCMKDSDNDGMDDSDPRENVGSCRLSKDARCKDDSGNVVGGIDTDKDGIPDQLEAELGTDPRKVDSDGDKLWDGEEDADHDGIYERNDGETDPNDADTDDDGLTDDFEDGWTNGVIADTDGDCIDDGVEDANQNGEFDPSETNPLEADTDGDGLPDGLIRGVGEDRDCNGERKRDANGNWEETDPTNPDSDFDGQSDFVEMTDGGWNLANLAQSTNPSHGACSLAGTAPAGTSGLAGVVSLLFAAAAIAGRRMKEKIPCLGKGKG